MTYYGNNIASSTNVEGLVVEGTNVYYTTQNGKIRKINSYGTDTEIINTGVTDLRNITIANNYIFVTNIGDNVLRVYKLSDNSLVSSVSTGSGGLRGVCTDWVSGNGTFNVYMCFENNTNISYCSFTGTLFGSVSVLTTISGHGKCIIFRSFSTYKYLYVASNTNSIAQINITNIVSPSTTYINTASGINTWGIVLDSLSNTMYATILFEGTHKLTYTPDSTTGSISSFTDTQFVADADPTNGTNNGLISGWG